MKNGKFHCYVHNSQIQARMRTTSNIALLCSISMPAVLVLGEQKEQQQEQEQQQHQQHARYQLTYDAIFDPKAVHDFSTRTGTTIPSSLAKQGSASSGGLDAIMRSIGQDFVKYWNKYKYNTTTFEQQQHEGDEEYVQNTTTTTTTTASSIETDTIQVNCLQGNTNSKKSICMVDFEEPGLDFSIHANMYELQQSQKQNLIPYTYLATPLQIQNNFTIDNDACLGVLAAVSFDVIVDADSNRAPGLFARDSLIHALKVFDTLLLTATHQHQHQHSPCPPSTWSIHERPTPLQLVQKNEILVQKKEIVPDQAKASSIESMILTKHTAIKRHHHTTSSTSNDSPHHLLHTHDPSISIWTIEEYGIQPLQHLFLNGQLRGTTSEAATIHAEAFVHPAMMAHPHPRNIVVVSDMPLDLLREILKYKSVEEVTLVGANMDAIDLVRFHMKELDRCFLDGEWRDCMEDGRVVVVKDTIMVWLDKQVLDSKAGGGGQGGSAGSGEDGRYDVILVDATTHMKNSSSRGHEEDDADEEDTFSDKIQDLMGSNSMVVFNTGSTPRQDVDLGVASDDISREKFLETVMYEGSGFGFPALYDEVSSSSTLFLQ